jgi:molybdenum cofactor cytidylyltransferase
MSPSHKNKLQPSQPHVTAIILAAGTSRRAGTDNKLILQFKKKTIIEAIVETVTSVALLDVVVITGHGRQQIQKILKDSEVRIIHNSLYKQGMSTSIRRGIRASSPHAKGYMICLGDMPLITTELLDQLFEAFVTSPQSAIVIAKFKERRGNPVIFSSTYRNELLQLQGDQGARSVYERHPDSITEIEVDDGRVFFDVDTQEDYDLLKTLES